MKFLFQIALLLAPFAIYWWIIRPRLERRFVDLYAYLDGFWERVWARIKAFKTWLIGTFGLFLSEAPAVAEQLAIIDLSFLLDKWQGSVRGIFLVLMLISVAFNTRPREEQV